MKTYALIAAYNEEKTVNSVISQTLKYVDRVILVNDGSKDKTLENVQRDFGNNSRVIVITYQENHGKGHAMILGFRRFLKDDADMLVTLDADGQHNPDDIPIVRILVEKGYSDMVIGSRYTTHVKVFPRARALFNIFSTMVLLLTSGGFFTDVASGFRCYSRYAVKAILPPLGLEGYGIELETLQIAKRIGLKISNVPVYCSYACGEKPNFGKLAIGYFKFVSKYRKDFLHRIFGIK